MKVISRGFKELPAWRFTGLVDLDEFSLPPNPAKLPEEPSTGGLRRARAGVGLRDAKRTLASRAPTPSRCIDAHEDEIDPGEKIHAVIVIADLRDHAAYKRILFRIELRPGVRHFLQEIGTIQIARPGELPIGRVLSADAKNVGHQRTHRRPLLIVRHTQSPNLLADAFENTHDWGQPQGAGECRAYPGMFVDHVEQAQRDRANRCFWGGDDGLVHGAYDKGVAGGGQQVVLVGNVPINSTGAGREPFGQRAEGQAALSSAVQELNRGGNDAVPGERLLPSFAAMRFLSHALS